MAIASILGPDTSVYAPSSTYISSRDHHATQAAQVPSPEVNPPSPVEDPALPAPDAESVAAAMLLQALRQNYVEHNVCENSTAVIEGDSSARNAAESLLQLRTEGDPSACNAAKSLLQLHTDDAIFLNTGTELCECDDYHNVNITFCEDANCSSAFPSDVIDLEVYQSVHPSDEEPLPSPKAVTITCHDTQLLLNAREGNALFDLPLHRHDESTSLPCRRCERLQDVSRKSWYAEGYRKLGYHRFQREDTISSDEDVVEVAADGTTQPQDPAMSSPRPKLCLTIKPPALDTSTRSLEPEPSSSNTPASNLDDNDDDDAPPPSSSNTSISLASPPSTHGPRQKKCTTTSPLKQVENASSSPSPSERDPPSSAKTNGDRPVYMLRDRTNLRRTSKGKDLPNDARSNALRENTALAAEGGEGKEEVPVTDATNFPTTTRARGRLRRMMARREGGMALVSPSFLLPYSLPQHPQNHLQNTLPLLQDTH